MLSYYHSYVPCWKFNYRNYQCNRRSTLLLLKGINLFGDLHHTQARCWRSKQCLTSISLNCAPGKLSWILNTYFKNKLPSSEKKPRLNIGDAPKATVLVVFLENQRSTDIKEQLCDILRKGGGRTLATPTEMAVGKAAGKCHSSHALGESRGTPAWSSQVPTEDSCPIKPFTEGSCT